MKFKLFLNFLGFLDIEYTRYKYWPQKGEEEGQGEDEEGTKTGASVSNRQH
jgi:hypothetical protein